MVTTAFPRGRSYYSGGAVELEPVRRPALAFEVALATIVATALLGFYALLVRQQKQ